MNPKIFVFLCAAVAVTQAAVLRPVLVEEEDIDELEAPRSGRQGRTLGLLKLGLEGIGAGAQVFGSAATTALGITAAAKPLVVAGLGKYALWRWLNLPGNHLGVYAGYRAPEANYGSNQYQSNQYASNGYNAQQNNFASNGYNSQQNNFASNGFNANSNFLNSGINIQPSGIRLNAGPFSAYANAQPSSSSFQQNSFNAQPATFASSSFNSQPTTFDSSSFNSQQPAQFETFAAKPDFDTFEAAPAFGSAAANEW